MITQNTSQDRIDKINALLDEAIELTDALRSPNLQGEEATYRKLRQVPFEQIHFPFFNESNNIDQFLLCLEQQHWTGNEWMKAYENKRGTEMPPWCIFQYLKLRGYQAKIGSELFEE